MNTTPPLAPREGAGDVSPAAAYAAPTLVRLGTLEELTKGGTETVDDGLGGGGDEGSI